MQQAIRCTADCLLDHLIVKNSLMSHFRAASNLELHLPTYTVHTLIPPTVANTSIHPFATPAPLTSTMVFHAKSKRRAPTKKSTTILDIPPELLGNIINTYLSRSEILNARLAHPHFTSECSRALQIQLKRIYIHPSPRALKATLGICAHPVFSREIEEVVLLGKVDWTEVRMRYSSTVRSVYNTWDCDVGSPSSRDFCAWPSEFPCAIMGTQEDAESVRPAAESRAEGGKTSPYGPLLDALASLPKLQRLTFAGEVAKPGFNQVSKTTIESVAKKAAVGKKPRTALADSQILMRILCYANVHIRHLRLDTEMPYIYDYLYAPYTTTAQPLLSVISASECLTSVELILDQGWAHTKWQRFCNRILAHARALQHLRIGWRSNSTCKQSLCEETALTLFDKHTWPNLQSIELLLETAQPEGKRTSRPTCQWFDFVGFLARQKSSLKRVVLSNVLFTTFYRQDYLLYSLPIAYSDPYPDLGVSGLIQEESAHATTRNILTSLAEMPLLEHTSFFINCYHHDKRCKPDDLPWPYVLGDCPRECGLYCLPERYACLNVPKTLVDDFEQLAEDMDVRLDEERRGWEFGEWVRKKQQQALEEDQ